MGLFNRIFKREKAEGKAKAAKPVKKEEFKGLSRLEAALKLVSDTPNAKNRREFSSALIEALFYIPLSEKGEPDVIEVETPRKIKVHLKTVKDEEGKILLPVYTSKKLFEKQNPGMDSLSISSKDLMLMLENSGASVLLINPDYEISGEVKVSDLAALAAAAGFKTKESNVALIMVKDGSTIHVSKIFRELTQEQYDYLKEAFSKYPEVVKAYTFTGIFEEGVPQDVVGVCFTGTRMKALSILQSISPGLSKALLGDQKINFLGFLEGPLVTQVESIVPAFYKKG
ncbi:MAG: SseB family protein [Chloroflexi bacterium]|nr:SseB family protein [Chloroflexota bacterium]